MNIAADSFSEIFDALACSAQAAPSNDKRRATRYEYPTRIQITPCDAEGNLTPLVVELHNFSTHGVCIICDEQLSLGSQFIAELPRKDQPAIHFLCTIVHVRQTIQGYALGAEFTCIVTPRSRDAAPAAHDIDRIRQSILA